MKPTNAFRLAVVVGVGAYALASSGCATLVPNTMRVELDHASHATQHAPLTSHPTAYGSNTANVVLHWDAPKGTFVEIGEGLSLDRHYCNSDPTTNSWGQTEGPREQFTLRIGKTFQLK